jgi:hypothetical protein
LLGLRNNAKDFIFYGIIRPFSETLLLVPMFQRGNEKRKATKTLEMIEGNFYES